MAKVSPLASFLRRRAKSALDRLLGTTLAGRSDFLDGVSPSPTNQRQLNRAAAMVERSRSLADRHHPASFKIRILKRAQLFDGSQLNR